MKEAKFAFQQSVPILFAYVFLGIAFGTMMAGIGYNVIWSLASAVFIFAGSLQIVMVSFLKAGLPLWSFAVMAFFINARHMFYGISLIERFRGAGWRRPYQIFALTDETYSILCSIQYPPGLDRHQIDFLIAAFIQYLSQVLPAAIMIILVIYCLKDTNWSGTAHGAPELIAVAATAGVHIWKKNMYLSIIVGTVCYMVLIRTVFRG